MKSWMVVGALVFAACCTEVQAIANIGFQLSQEASDALLSGPAELHVCVGANCWDDTVDANDAGTGSSSFDKETRTLSLRQQTSSGERADVSLTASRDGGELFTHTWSDVAFTHITPNGPACGGDAYGVADAPLKF